VILVNLWALRGNRGLMVERLKSGPGVKRWDRIYFTFSTLLYFVSLVVAGLDVGRFGWTGPLPGWAYAAGTAIYILGNAIFLWVKVTNRFFSTLVRIQTDRGHTVCREGPYRYIRHPGYIGGMLYMLAGALLLGSLWAVLMQALACLSLVVRTALEDWTLQKELPGYADYARQVKYRLVPGIW
jgi:protein-S-isoprenylcysteine O-methyltransferase Ste14